VIGIHLLIPHYQILNQNNMAINKICIGSAQDGFDYNLCPDKNLFTGTSYFEKIFGRLTSLEEDLFVFSSGVYASDLIVKREDREHFVRNIEIFVEVNNFHLLNNIKEKLEYALFKVSRDNWSINFIKTKKRSFVEIDPEPQDGAVLLFSGGLDSMCAAYDFIRKNTNLVLVSHNSQGNTVIDSCQNAIHTSLEEFFKKTIEHIHIKVYGRKYKNLMFPEERENTQRTRSFLFLTLAALVSRRKGFNKVLFMAENGQFAIHLPLNQARIGPFSTHTADPEFINKTQEIFQELLMNSSFEIINPYLYKTKAEVFSLLPKELKQASSKSATCWMISRTPGNKHCGYCIPCISRRIALEFNDIKFDEYSHDIFNLDLNQLKDDDDKKRNIIDYIEFIAKFKNTSEKYSLNIIKQFPELYNQSIDMDQAIALYNRVADQSFKVLSKYPLISKFIE
jgi:7-cyano-7-deazaguanine synthase in queuosine biosynthesis